MAETLEEQLFRRYWDDGLLDLLAGAGVLMAGVAWLAGVVAVGGALAVLPIVLWRPLRARLVEPRLGQVEFRAKRIARQQRHSLALLGAGVLAFALVLAVALTRTRGGGGIGAPLVAGLPALLVALPAFAVGASLGVRRLHFYGLTLLAGGGLVIVLDADPGWALVGGGCVAVIVGAILLRRLLRIAVEVEA